MTRESISDTSGRVIYWGKSSVSISPASGDTRMSGFALSCELHQIQNNLALETGLSRLLKGTDKHFIILVGDRGYNYLPHNVSSVNIKKLKVGVNKYHISTIALTITYGVKTC